MGNCQAAEVDMLVIQHPSGQMERFYWPMTAKEVMSANPGHYVAIIVTAPASSSSSGSTDSSGKKTDSSTVQLLKLLSPDDTLLMSRFYYLVTFEDVLKVFGSKRCVKLSKLLARQERKKRNKHHEDNYENRASTSTTNNILSSEMDNELDKTDQDQVFELQTGNQRTTKCGQWKPSLQSIAEVGN